MPRYLYDPHPTPCPQDLYIVPATVMLLLSFSTDSLRIEGKICHQRCMYYYIHIEMKMYYYIHNENTTCIRRMPAKLLLQQQ